MEHQRPSRPAPRGAFAVLLSILACPAGAQWVVNDPVHQAQNVLTQMQAMARDAAEYGQQATRWYATYRHYQQQLVRMQGIIASFRPPSGGRVLPVADDHLVAQKCGGTGAWGGGALRALLPDSSGDYAGQQRDLCAQIQRLENRRFNYTVRFIDETLPKVRADLDRVQAMRSLDNSQGTVDGSSQAGIQLSAELQGQFQQWDAQMKSYDAVLGRLRDAQRQLAAMALGGEQRALGTMARTAALQRALRTDR